MNRTAAYSRRWSTRVGVAGLGAALLVTPFLHGQRAADADTAVTAASPARFEVPPDDAAADWPARPPAAGTPVGATLRPLGEVTVSQPNTVISNRLITGTVTVAASNVTIVNSRIAGTGDYGVNVLPGASARILHTTITGFENGVTGSDYVANYVEVTGLTADGFKLGSRVVVANSWCHGMTPSKGAHADCGQVQAGEVDLVVRHNWFDIESRDGNSALFIAPSLGPSSPGPVTLYDNVLGGGNYSLYCVAGDFGRYVIGHITIQGNHFLRRSRYGPATVNVPVVWVDNTWLDTGLPVPA